MYIVLVPLWHLVWVETVRIKLFAVPSLLFPPLILFFLYGILLALSDRSVPCCCVYLLSASLTFVNHDTYSHNGYQARSYRVVADQLLHLHSLGRLSVCVLRTMLPWVTLFLQGKEECKKLTINPPNSLWTNPRSSARSIYADGQHEQR